MNCTSLNTKENTKISGGTFVPLQQFLENGILFRNVEVNYFIDGNISEIHNISDESIELSPEEEKKFYGQALKTKML